MDRQGHDYTAAMAFAQQQQSANIQQQPQQFGFPQQQQYPPTAHGPPFMPPHPSLQQFPYPRPIQQPQYPHPSPHPHLLQMQQQQRPPPAFPLHMAPHLVPPPFHNPYDSAPPPSPPPSDPELQKRIDKLVEYAAKNGPEFEAMICKKEQDNPDFGFLFGSEGHSYYRYKLWMATRPPGGPFNPSFPPSSVSVMHPPNSMMNPPPLNAPQLSGPNPTMPSAGIMGAPHMHQPPFPAFYEKHRQQSPSFVGHGQSDYEPSYRPFRGLSRPLPSDVEMELHNVLNNLSGTKESIKGAKNWFMQRSPFVPALAEALRDHIFALDESERQLHIVYLANDILFDSLQRRVNPHELDIEALVFRPVLGSMLSRIYHNPQNKEENQSRLQKILQFWASKEVYDQDTIHALENEMLGGVPMNSFPGAQRLSPDPSSTGVHHQASNLTSWQSDKQTLLPNLLDQDFREKPVPVMPPLTPQQYHLAQVPSSGFTGPIPMPPMQPVTQLPGSHTLPASSASTGKKLPPYPLFPPGLIPGMVRKMQIGSGVPYSPMSPLDIPTVIPPSNDSPSDILERVSKFFREIGEVNPSEGPLKSSDSRDDYEEYDREPAVRKGGACIPPPPDLLVDPESGTLPDGSVERKPGSSDSGQPGLGSGGNSNETSQYDDVYSSYRKQRSTNYHSSMTVRAATR